MGKLNGGRVLFTVALVSVVLGAIFLFHEVVLLVAVVVERHRRRVSPPETGLATDLLTIVIGADLVVLLLLFGWLVWQGTEGGEMRELLPYFLPPVLGFYGVYLFGCCVREALVPPPGPPDSPPTGEPTRPVGTPLSGRGVPGLRVYATAATAWLAWGAVGWPRDWLGGFGIALVSLLVGRGVERIAVRWQQKRGGNNTGP